MKLQASARNITDELMDRYKTRDDGNIKAYPDSLKKFAVSLHMKSARAYNYVRSTFQVFK